MMFEFIFHFHLTSSSNQNWQGFKVLLGSISAKLENMRGSLFAGVQHTQVTCANHPIRADGGLCSSLMSLSSKLQFIRKIYSCKNFFLRVGILLVILYILMDDAFSGNTFFSVIFTWVLDLASTKFD